jgi:hypothetical protein
MLADTALITTKNLTKSYHASKSGIRVSSKIPATFMSGLRASVLRYVLATCWGKYFIYCYKYFRYCSKYLAYCSKYPGEIANFPSQGSNISFIYINISFRRHFFPKTFKNISLQVYLISFIDINIRNIYINISFRDFRQSFSDTF